MQQKTNLIKSEKHIIKEYSRKYKKQTKFYKQIYLKQTNFKKNENVFIISESEFKRITNIISEVGTLKQKEQELKNHIQQLKIESKETQKEIKQENKQLKKELTESNNNLNKLKTEYIKTKQEVTEKQDQINNLNVELIKEKDYSKNLLNNISVLQIGFIDLLNRNFINRLFNKKTDSVKIISDQLKLKEIEIKKK